MAIELITSDKKQPLWYAACNGIATYSKNGYFCNGGIMSFDDEMKQCWENRNKIMLHIEGLRQKGVEKISINDICSKLKLTKGFITFVLIKEFGELEEEN